MILVPHTLHYTHHQHWMHTCTCTIHATIHATIHVRYMYDTCMIHVRYMYDTCTIHVQNSVCLLFTAYIGTQLIHSQHTSSSMLSVRFANFLCMIFLPPNCQRSSTLSQNLVMSVSAFPPLMITSVMSSVVVIAISTKFT